jgi:hypothetical protein
MKSKNSSNEEGQKIGGLVKIEYNKALHVLCALSRTLEVVAHPKEKTKNKKVN